MTCRSLGLGVLAIGVLAACADAGDPDATTTATETPTSTTAPPSTTTPTTPATPSPAPSPTSRAGGVPPLEELEIHTGGVGPLEVGVPPEDNPGAAMIEYIPDHCAEVVTDDQDPGRWVVTAYERGSDQSYSGSPVRPVHVGADEDGVHRIDVLGVTPTTAEGVGIGTPEEELLDTYPELEGPYDNQISEVWWLTADDGTLVFETQGPESGLREEGAVDSVILVRVLEPGVDPAFGTANTDDVAGGCL